MTFSLSAQVYALDKTQKWTPLTTDIVTVTFLYNEQSKTTRIISKDNSDKIIVNSNITANMQYRRPSETFVQWFDSQHILYGLNLTSVTDAEGFEREFEYATGKRVRPGQAQAPAAPLSTAHKKPTVNDLAAQLDSLTAEVSAATSAAPSVMARKQSNASSVAAHQGSAIAAAPATAYNNNNFEPANKTNNSSFSDIKSVASADQTTPGSALTSKVSLMAQTTSATGDMKLVNSLKQRVKELEMQNMNLETEKGGLHADIASHLKTVSGLQNQIKQLESDLDKLKNAFQQNTANVQMWKQQLQSYQEMNEALTVKLTTISELHEKLGEVLRQE